ncbi:hypothetical protein [Ktedonobacter racemifer]|uniref:hypothetical protein n=1 Tax=Ktedonobacter racemifer TaxID=363277 RepID=UPI00058D26D9|nr:hypothetical protein [Ktedonobacter racemifer]
MTKRKAYAILTQSTASTNTANAGATPRTQAQAHGFAGLRFNKQKKNEPEHPEQLKSGMQKYNGTSLSKLVLLTENTVPVNSANKQFEVTTTCF